MHLLVLEVYVKHQVDIFGSMYKFDNHKLICYNKVRLMNKSYVVCPKCGKKLFRIDEKSVYKNIYIWCKNCHKEIVIKEPLSQDMIIKK